MQSPAILYVDDEPENLFSFRAAFRRHFTVLTAENAAQALELLEKEPVAVLLCDQRMAGMTGSELLALVRARKPEVVRLLVTGYSDLSVVVDAINKGHTYYYVTKPWRQEELKIILENALSKWRLEQDHERLTAEKFQLEKNVLEAEKAAAEARLLVLHGKLQPHFLFNALNTLPALIRTRPEKAVEFTHALARLLRRLTEQSETPAHSLEVEIAVARDYLFLQGIRFEDKLQVEWRLPDPLPDRILPQLALQLLLENALKHNELSREQPLLLRVVVDGDELRVQNRYQPRETAEEGMGIGLENIRKRYALLGDRLPETRLHDGLYEVKLPLLPHG